MHWQEVTNREIKEKSDVLKDIIIDQSTSGGAPTVSASALPRPRQPITIASSAAQSDDQEGDAVDQNEESDASLAEGVDQTLDISQPSTSCSLNLRNAHSSIEESISHTVHALQRVEDHFYQLSGLITPIKEGAAASTVPVSVLSDAAMTLDQLKDKLSLLQNVTRES